MRRYRVCIAGFVFLTAFASAEEPGLTVTHPLTESDIEQALALGNDPDAKLPGVFLGAAGFDFAPMRDDSNRTGSFIQHRRRRQTTGFGVELHTPYSWLAKTTRDQATKGREMMPRHVNDKLLAPVMRVLCLSDVPQIDYEGVYGTVVESVTLRATQKGVADLTPSHTMRIPDRVRSPEGEVIDMGPLLAEFDIEAVRALGTRDKKGEFFIVIVSEKGKEKKFMVKNKHLKKLY